MLNIKPSWLWYAFTGLTKSPDLSWKVLRIFYAFIVFSPPTLWRTLDKRMASWSTVTYQCKATTPPQLLHKAADWWSQTEAPHSPSHAVLFCMNRRAIMLCGTWWHSGLLHLALKNICTSCNLRKEAEIPLQQLRLPIHSSLLGYVANVMNCNHFLPHFRKVCSITSS